MFIQTMKLLTTKTKRGKHFNCKKSLWVILVLGYIPPLTTIWQQKLTIWPNSMTFWSKVQTSLSSKRNLPERVKEPENGVQCDLLTRSTKCRVNTHLMIKSFRSFLKEGRKEFLPFRGICSFNLKGKGMEEKENAT